MSNSQIFFFVPWPSSKLQTKFVFFKGCFKHVRLCVCVCVCVYAKVFGGVTSTDSQRYNCTSLVVQIGAFHSPSIFLSLDDPIGWLPLRRKPLTNHSMAFVTKGKIMIIVILRISQITNLFHLKAKLQCSNAAEATVALKAQRRRGMSDVSCLH